MHLPGGCLDHIRLATVRFGLRLCERLARGSTASSKSPVLRRDISSKTQVQSGVTAPVDTYLRERRAAVIPLSLKFCEATCVFAHQKMRGVFARAFLHHVVFPQPATPATIKEPLLDTCSSAKRQASCSCEPEKSSQGPTNSGTRCGIQVGRKTDSDYCRTIMRNLHTSSKHFFLTVALWPRVLC